MEGGLRYVGIPAPGSNPKKRERYMPTTMKELYYCDVHRRNRKRRKTDNNLVEMGSERGQHILRHAL